MKSRFVYGPVPILIAAALFAGDLVFGVHWGLLVLITIVCTGSVYEMGHAFSSGTMRVPYVLAAGCAGIWILLAGLLFLRPAEVMNLAPEVVFSSPSELFYFGLFVVPLHLFMGVFVLVGIRTCTPETVRGVLAGFALTVFFSVIYIQTFPLVKLFDGRPTTATFWVLFIVLVNKGADSGSYFVGKWLGMHRMTPRLSPNKTWEGLGGGLVTGLFIALLFALYSRLGDQHPGLVIAGAGGLLSLAGAAGDLVGSLLKRGAGVEDSSVLFPELGGIMDISDCFLVSLPVSLLLLLLIV